MRKNNKECTRKVYNLNALIKQSLSSTRIPSVLEPRHLYRTDQKRPDGLTLVPWAVGKQLLWDVTVVVCQLVISGSLTLRNTKYVVLE